MKILKNKYFILWMIGFFAIVCLCLYFNLEVKIIASAFLPMRCQSHWC